MTLSRLHLNPKMGFVAFWLAVSSSFYSPPAAHIVYADPILNASYTQPVQSIEMPPLAEQTALETVWINKLRPYGTYPNLYAWGNCTEYVASRLSLPDNLGNANNWSYMAAADGLAVGNIPKEGSIAQTTGDSYLGHVAVVESVNPDGSFLISEMNAQGLGVIDERTATTDEFPSFIYV